MDLYDRKALSLKETRLPRDWEARFSKRLLQGYINYLWKDWPWIHMDCICQQRNVKNLFRDNDNILDGTPPEELCLSGGYQYFNKTAVLYLAYGGDLEVHWRINEPKFPVYWEKWLTGAYKSWARNCEPQERLDARFVFALRHFSPQDDKRVQAWIGLGEKPSKTDLDDIECLIHWHVQQCDLIEARARAKVSTEEARELDGGDWWRTEGVAQRAKAYHSTLFPTCRAILAIGRNPMPEKQHVLLVLTSHNQDMSSGPPTFDSIAPKDIVEKRSEMIVEVSLQTAIRYLQLLERKEEFANMAFRTKNDERREAIYEDIRRRAHYELEGLRDFSGTIGGRRTRRGRKRSRRPVTLTLTVDAFMEAAWRRIVADEHSLALLSSSADLRRSMQDEDINTSAMNEGDDYKSWSMAVRDWGRRMLFWRNKTWSIE